jgi:hypothetical protein
MIRNPHYFLTGFFILLLTACQPRIEKYTDAGRLPVIFPDYTNILIPPNIAPLNFTVKEAGIGYEIQLYLTGGDPLIIRSTEPAIQIDIDKWHQILEKGKGSKLMMDILVQDKTGVWHKYQTIVNEVASENIDSHLAYRLINTGYVLWNKLGIYQRNLENFDESPIIENEAFDFGCINCHAFSNNDPNTMMMHIRARHGGTIINHKGKLTKVETKTKYTLSAGAYPCWAPDGNHIAYSVNNIGQYFCTGDIRIEVTDEASDLVVYDLENNTITTSPKVSTPSRENLPIWSPDGKYLYFISAAPASNLNTRIDAQYDLLRIGFDATTNTWGDKVDTIVNSKDLGRSVSFPKISPNGKYLMFSTSTSGYFTIHHPGTDLFLLNMQTMAYQKMDINSDQTDSYHSFSSGGKWFVFSSKRMDGLFTRPFFSYLDENGKASKPFVLPQKDPDFYESFVQNYNIPELITGEIPVSAIALRDKILEEAVAVQIDPKVDTLFLKQHLARK